MTFLSSPLTTDIPLLLPVHLSTINVNNLRCHPVRWFTNLATYQNHHCARPQWTNLTSLNLPASPTLFRDLDIESSLCIDAPQPLRKSVYLALMGSYLQMRCQNLCLLGAQSCHLPVRHFQHLPSVFRVQPTPLGLAFKALCDLFSNFFSVSEPKFIPCPGSSIPHVRSALCTFCICSCSTLTWLFTHCPPAEMSSGFCPPHTDARAI